jgi:hypothetical protein
MKRWQVCGTWAGKILNVPFFRLSGHLRGL